MSQLHDLLHGALEMDPLFWDALYGREAGIQIQSMLRGDAVLEPEVKRGGQSPK